MSQGLAAPLPMVSGTDTILLIAHHTMIIDGRRSVWASTDSGSLRSA